jgi:hypothetical protein
MKTRISGRKITTDNFDTKLAPMACFAAGILVLVLSFWKLTRLDLSEAQLFFGVLLTLCVSLLSIVVGLLLPMSSLSLDVKPPPTPCHHERN